MSKSGHRAQRRVFKPGPLHFLRRMKEELRGYDTDELLFKEREAVNVKVRMNSEEQRYYDRALELVDTYFPSRGRTLAAIVYGKRAASSLYALAETLKRRQLKMGNAPDLVYDATLDKEPLRVLDDRSLDAAAERATIAAILAELEPRVRPKVAAELSVSKWGPMVGHLSDKGVVPDSSGQVVVFTEYRGDRHLAGGTVPPGRFQHRTLRRGHGSQRAGRRPEEVPRRRLPGDCFYRCRE